MGTNQGLMSFDPYNNILQTAKFDLNTRYETIKSSIESILIDKNKTIWLGTTSNGIIKISTINDTYTIKNIPITNKRILSLSIKQNGNLLCGTENDGLFEIHKKNKKIINYKFD